MKNYEKVNNYFLNRIHKSLIDLAKGLKYSKFNIAILEDRFEDAKLADPDQWSILTNSDYCNDTRTVFEFGKDLIAGWILEDYVEWKLKKLKLDVYKDGSDKDRKFNKYPTCNSDFAFNYKNNKFKLEMITDYGNCWKRDNAVTLRDKKLERLKEHDSLLLCVNLIDDKFFIFDPNYDNTVQLVYFESFKLFGNKPAIRIVFPNLIDNYESAFSDPESINIQFKRIFSE